MTVNDLRQIVKELDGDMPVLTARVGADYATGVPMCIEEVGVRALWRIPKHPIDAQALWASEKSFHEDWPEYPPVWALVIGWEP